MAHQLKNQNLPSSELKWTNRFIDVAEFINMVDDRHIEAETGIGYDFDGNYNYGARYSLSLAAKISITLTNITFELMIHVIDLPPEILQRMIHSVIRMGTLEDLL